MEKSVVSLTFDDGLRCQLARGLPALDHHGLVATLFLVANEDANHTDGERHPDWPKLTWTSWSAIGTKRPLDRGDGSRNRKFAVDGASLVDEGLKELVRLLAEG